MPDESPPAGEKRGTVTVSNYSLIMELDPEIELLARRLWPRAKGVVRPDGTEAHRIEVDSTLDSVQLVRMLSREFPLEIKDPVNRWADLNAGLDRRTADETTTLRLGRCQPPAARFRGELRAFQEEGLDWLGKMDGRALLADEMGLGKTVQALAFVADRWQTAFPVVVVAPLVTLVNWEREIKKFLRGSAPPRDAGSASEGDLLHQNKIDVYGDLGSKGASPAVVRIKKTKGPWSRAADIYLLNYDIASARAKEIAAARPATVIFDEVQNLRHRGTAKWEACAQIANSARYRIGLSGTPLYNSGVEIIPIADVLRPGSLPDRGDFIAAYCSAYDPDKTSRDARPALSVLLRRRLMLRRRKSEVLSDLPDKTRIREEIDIDEKVYDDLVGDLAARVKRAYDRVQGAKRHGLTSEERAGALELSAEMAAMRAQERKAAGIAKVPYAAKYLRTLLADNPDDKFVIFCHHLSVHEGLMKSLADHDPVQIIGGQSADERQKQIDAFQSSNPFRAARLAICGLRAGGVGISLTAAQYVIFAELDWSPAVHRQAEDRLHRIGQKNAVFAHYLVGKATFDEQIGDKLLAKAQEINAVLSDRSEAVLTDEEAARILGDRFGSRGVAAEASTLTQK